jgi:hypothetical protein
MWRADSASAVPRGAGRNAPDSRRARWRIELPGCARGRRFVPLVAEPQRRHVTRDLVLASTFESPCDDGTDFTCESTDPSS